MIGAMQPAPVRASRDLAELRRLRLAIEASGEVIFTTDTTGMFSYVNPEFVRTYGYKPGEVIGRCTPRILKSGTTRPAEYVSFWSQLQDKQVVKREFVNRTKSGQVLNIESSANPIIDEAGEVVGFLAVQRDITARKQVEAALRDSERRYRTLAEAAQDSIFIVDLEGRIEYANRVSGTRFGLASGGTIGKRLEEVFPAETAGQMLNQLARVFETGQRQFVEERFTSPQGELWLETWLVPMVDETAKVRAVMGIARDVSERKGLERQFLQAQKLEAVGRLAGGIAHDFNNLLTAILGYSELLHDRLHESPDILDDLDEIRKAGERARRLTRQLLAFSRKQETVRQVVDLNAVLADLQRLLGRVVGEDIVLAVAAGRDVSPVIADPGHIEQIVLNLAVNARDAMPKGGALTIATANVDLDEAFVRRHVAATAGPYVSLTVKDSGCGMTPEVMAHVFEPFFTTKPQGRGTGLGLSTVYGIVKQNGGYITIDSRTGDGTTVTVFWPRRADGRGTTAPEAAGPLRQPRGMETILIAEDEPGIRALMRRTLEAYGYRVLEAGDVTEAAAAAAGHDGPIDLLLSDVIMPGLNGPDLAQHIIAQRPEVKVLYVSGFPNSAISDSARRRPHMSFLAKPFTPYALVTKVRETLDS